MAFIDPIVFNEGGTPETELFRVSTGDNRSTYSDVPGTLLVKAEHNYARRTRRVFRADTNKITPDPFLPAQNTKVSASLYLVADLPVAGYSVEEIQDLYTGLTTTLNYSGGDLLLKWLAGQS